MTREEARKAAEVMLAYADGKEIEEFNEYSNDWEIVGNPGFNFGINAYRVKKEPTYRPFKDKDECWAEMQKYQPFGWVKHKGNGILSSITGLSNDNYLYYYNEEFTFADGTPFGIKVDDYEND